MMADNRGMHECFSSLRAHGAKLISLALLLALTFSLAPASASAGVFGLQPSVALAEETQVQTQTTSLQERLAAIEGVTSVTPIEQTPLEDGTLPFKEKYLITITQPISWDDPGLGTFEQRVEVGYQGDTNVNEFKADGYMLYDVLDPDYLKSDDRDELCKTYNANLISFEYLFGESTPAGLSSRSTDLWECPTAENAAADFHAIIGKISQVLSDKRIFTGASKGGFTTNVQAYVHPGDADEKVQSIWNILNSASDLSAYSQQSLFFPYYVQAATQMGENAIDFSYLRTALNAAYEEAKAKDPSTSEDLYKLAVTPDMDENLLWNTMFTAEQQEAFQYDDTLRNELISWSQTTTAHVVMIYGGIDVWYPTRIPDVDNPSIYRYVAPALNHRVRISDLTESEQAELWAALNGWLSDSTEPASEATITNVLANTSDDALPLSAACCVLVSMRQSDTSRGCGRFLGPLRRCNLAVSCGCRSYRTPASRPLGTS